MLSDASLYPTENEHRPDLLRASFAQKLSLNRRKIGSFFLLLVIATVLVSSLALLSASILIFALQIAGFLGLGFLHSSVLRTNAAGFTQPEKEVYSLILSMIVLGVVGTFLFLLKRELFVQTAFAFACAFAWPFAATSAANLFTDLLTTPTASWRYNADLPLQKATTFLNSMPVRFRIEMDAFGGDERTVAFRAPVRMKLGSIFYHTVQEQNEKGASDIQLQDLNGEAYQWTFSISRFGWPRFLDPETDLMENGVKPNAVIVARRVKP